MLIVNNTALHTWNFVKMVDLMLCIYGYIQQFGPLTWELKVPLFLQKKTNCSAAIVKTKHHKDFKTCSIHGLHTRIQASESQPMNDPHFQIASQSETVLCFCQPISNSCTSVTTPPQLKVNQSLTFSLLKFQLILEFLCFV